MAASCSPAIWCSMSAPMSATASPRSAGSARGWSRSSRSPHLVKVLKLLYGRSAGVAIEAVAVGRAAGTIEHDDQRRQSDRLDGVAGVRQRRARRAGLGSAALDQISRGAGDDARCADRQARHAVPSSRSTSKASRRRRWRDCRSRSRRCRSSSRPSSATSRAPASSAASRSATRASTPRSARARLL